MIKGCDQYEARDSKEGRATGVKCARDPASSARPWSQTRCVATGELEISRVGQRLRRPLLGQDRCPQQEGRFWGLNGAGQKNSISDRRP